jgi:chemotaxis protein methyltransferase CheR
MELEQYAHIKRSVQSLLNINLGAYKDEQMRRRLDSWLVRSGSPSWEAYLRLLRGDTLELSRFRDYLTINVSAFFRDPERWQVLRQAILPELLKDSLYLRPLGAGLRIWSAGCSMGAEPYSLAILLDDLAPARRHTLLATDLDRSILKKAQAGGPYTSEEIQNIPASHRPACFAPGGPPYYIQPRLARRVTFREHNLLSEPFETDFDLIVCRNVVIYFTGETKEHLFRKFWTALRPGGVLFLGGTEILPRPNDFGFHSVAIHVPGQDGTRASQSKVQPSFYYKESL